MYQRSSYKVVCLYIRLHGEIHKTGTTETSPYVEELLPSYYAGKTADVGEKEFERLLGRKLPEAGYRFYKKNRMVIDENCTVADLRYSKRWVGRLFSGAIRFAHAFLWKTGNRSAANTIMMGVYHQPCAGLQSSAECRGGRWKACWKCSTDICLRGWANS